jgi:molecular chaperone GrpE (heat shock protein)
VPLREPLRAAIAVLRAPAKKKRKRKAAANSEGQAKNIKAKQAAIKKAVALQQKLSEANKKLKDEKESAKIAKEQFRKWRYRNPEHELKTKFDDSCKILVPKLKGDQLESLLKRFREEVLSKTRETVTTTVRKLAASVADYTVEKIPILHPSAFELLAGRWAGWN